MTKIRRWCVLITGIVVQVGLIVLLLLMDQAGMADVVLAPVEGNPAICRVVSVAPFADGRLHGLQTGMFVQRVHFSKPGPGPYPPLPELGMPDPDHPPPFHIVHCHIVSGAIPMEIVGNEQLRPFLIHAPMPPADLLNIVLGTILGISFHLAGALIFLRAQNRPTARVAYALFYVFSLVCLVFNGRDPQYIWGMFSFFALTTLTSGLSTTFVCLFPYPQSSVPQKGHVRYRKWKRILPYIPLICSLLLTVAGIWSFLVFIDYRPIISLLGGGFNGACLLIILGMLLWGLRRLNQYERQFARMVFVGMVFVLLPLVLRFTGFPLAIEGQGSLVRLLPIPLLALPIICDYALFRHQLIGTTSLVSRQVMRVLLWIVLACLFVFPVIVVHRLLEQSVPFLPEWIRDYCYAGLLGICLCLFPLVWNKVRDVGDHIFYRDFYQYNHALRELSTELTRLQGLDQVSAFILPRLAHLLNTSDCVLFVRAITQDEMHYQMSRHVASTDTWHMYRHAIEPERLETEQLVHIADQALIHVKKKAYEPVVVDGILVLALYDGSCISGFLCLGPKKNRELYSRQDKSFLTTLAAQLSVVEVNNRYLLQARQDAQKLTALNRRVISAQEEERKHLALDLHDDVLQQAMLLVRQLSDAATMNDVADAMPLARGVVKDLRRTCLALRPVLLDELGLAESLRWLAKQTEQLGDGKLRVEFHCSSVLIGRVPATAEVALYRIVQEALTNSVKHADASRVIVRLRDIMMYDEGSMYRKMTVTIADNGRGARQHKLFPPPVNNLGLVGMRERIAAIGGQLQMRTAPGCGFIVRAVYREHIQRNEKSRNISAALLLPDQALIPG